MKTANTALGAFEAKNKFSELLDRVGRGAEFTITKHDRPIARLIPAASPTKELRKKAAGQLRAMSGRYSLRGLSVRALIDEGRR